MYGRRMQTTYYAANTGTQAAVLEPSLTGSAYIDNLLSRAFDYCVRGYEAARSAVSDYLGLDQIIVLAHGQNKPGNRNKATKKGGWFVRAGAGTNKHKKRKH